MPQPYAPHQSLDCALCRRRAWYAMEMRANHSGSGPDYAGLARDHVLEAHQPGICRQCDAPFTRLGDPIDKFSGMCFICLQTGGDYVSRA